MVLSTYADGPETDRHRDTSANRLLPGQTGAQIVTGARRTTARIGDRNTQAVVPAAHIFEPFAELIINLERAAPVAVVGRGSARQSLGRKGEPVVEGGSCDSVPGRRRGSLQMPGLGIPD